MSLLERLEQAMRRYRKYRATMRVLRQLDDRELDDLGIGRHRLRELAWAGAEQGSGA